MHCHIPQMLTPKLPSLLQALITEDHFPGSRGRELYTDLCKENTSTNFQRCNFGWSLQAATGRTLTSICSASATPCCCAMASSRSHTCAIARSYTVMMLSPARPPAQESQLHLPGHTLLCVAFWRQHAATQASPAKGKSNSRVQSPHQNGAPVKSVNLSQSR